MITATLNSSGGVSDWFDDIIPEALHMPCPHCATQPFENCHGGHPDEFVGPLGRVVRLHAPRYRQTRAYLIRHRAV